MNIRFCNQESELFFESYLCKIIISIANVTLTISHIIITVLPVLYSSYSDSQMCGSELVDALNFVCEDRGYLNCKYIF
uniref:Insulin-like domain-containing protein n=1 Tax=Anabas testudineus TaxID=64144 RepID=A0A3Q1IFD3_ANATE